MMDAGDAALSHPRATIVVRRVINLAKRLQHSLTVQARQDRARGGVIFDGVAVRANASALVGVLTLG